MRAGGVVEWGDDLTLKECTENDETGLTHCSFGWLSGMKGG